MVRQLRRRSFNLNLAAFNASFNASFWSQVDHLLAAADYTYQATPSDL